MAAGLSRNTENAYIAWSPRSWFLRKNKNHAGKWRNTVLKERRNKVIGQQEYNK